MRIIRIVSLTLILVFLFAATALGVGDFNLVYHSGSNDSAAWGDQWSVPIPEYNVALHINEIGDGYGETGYVIYVSRDGKLNNARDRVFIKAWPDFKSAMQIRFCEIWTLDLHDYYGDRYDDYYLIAALHWSNGDGSVQYVTDLALVGYDGGAGYGYDRLDYTGDGVLINSLGNNAFEVFGGDEMRIEDVLMIDLGYDLEDGVNDEEEYEEVLSYFPRFTGTLTGVNEIEEDPVYLQFKHFDRGISRGMHTALDDIKEMYGSLSYRLVRPLYDVDTGEPVATVYTRVHFDEGQGIFAQIEDVVWEAPEQPSLPVGEPADSAGASANVPAINGCISLPYTIFDETPDEVVAKALDIDLDGIAENLYYGGDAVRNDLYLQFIPETELLESGNTAESYSGSYLHLYPFAQSPTGRIDDWGIFVPTHLSLFTGDDEELYACVESEAFGATGIPAKTLEFFQKQDDSTELIPISVDYKKFIVDTSWDNLYHGVMLQDYLAGAYCEYISGLGRWCLAFTQSDVAEYNNLSRIRLRTYLTIENGELKLIARYLDDRLVEGPYDSASTGQTEPADKPESPAAGVAADGAFIRIETEIEDLQSRMLVDGSAYTLRATAFDANDVPLDNDAQDGIKWTIADGTGQLGTTANLIPGLIVFYPDKSSEQVTLVAANDELGLQAQITLNVSPFSFDFHSGNTATVTGYAGQSQNILLPMTVSVGNTDYDVTAIGEHAFANSAITAAIIPEGYMTIEESAFENCTQLSTVQLPDSMACIKPWAFMNCSALTELSLGKKLNSIEDGAFYGCTSLVSFDVDPENEILYTDAESGALYAARSVDDHPSKTAWPRSTLVCLPAARGVINCVLPYEVTEIARYAFACCSTLEDVTIVNTNVSLVGVHFDDSPNLRLLLYQGSDAEQTAINTGLNYARILDWDRDIPIFLNDYSGFISGYSSKMKKAELQRLKENYAYVSKWTLFNLFDGMTDPVILRIYTGADATWNGSCSGMCSLALINRVSRLSKEQAFQEHLSDLGSEHVRGLKAPSEEPRVADLVNYYQLMCGYPDNYIKAYEENRELAYYKDDQGNEKTYHRAENGLKIIEALKKGNPVKTSVIKEDFTDCHSIVLECITDETDTDLMIKCYNPNDSTEQKATLSKDGSHFSHNGYSIAYHPRSELNEIDLRNYFTNESIPALKTSYGDFEGRILGYMEISDTSENGLIKEMFTYRQKLEENGRFIDDDLILLPDIPQSDINNQAYMFLSSKPVNNGFTVQLNDVENATFAILDERMPFAAIVDDAITIDTDFLTKNVQIQTENGGPLRLILTPLSSSVSDYILDIAATDATTLSARWDDQGLLLASDSKDPLVIYRLNAEADSTELLPVTKEGTYLPGSALSDGALTQADDANLIAAESTASPAPTADAQQEQEGAPSPNRAPVLDIRFVYLLLALVSAAGLGAVLFALFARK